MERGKRKAGALWACREEGAPCCCKGGKRCNEVPARKGEKSFSTAFFLLDLRSPDLIFWLLMKGEESFLSPSVPSSSSFFLSSFCDENRACTRE